MSTPRPPPKNDYVPPAPLPGSLRRPASTIGGASAGAGASGTQATVDPNDYLDRAEEEWNERVDKEIGGLAGGLEVLVKSFAADPTPTPSQQQQHALPLSSLSLGLTHAGLLKNAQNLLKIAHELKLLWLVAPEIGLAEAREAAAKAAEGNEQESEGEKEERELEELRQEVAALEKEWRGLSVA